MSNPARLPYLGEMVHYAPIARPPQYQPTATHCQAALITDPCRHTPPTPTPDPDCRVSLTVFPPPHSPAHPAFLPLAHVHHDETARAEGTWHFAH